MNTPQEIIGDIHGDNEHDSDVRALLRALECNFATQGIIRRVLDVNSDRAARAAIHEARVQHGAPIVSDEHGYHIAKDNAELQEWIKRRAGELRAYVRSSLDVYLALRRVGLIESDNYFEALNLANTGYTQHIEVSQPQEVVA